MSNIGDFFQSNSIYIQAFSTVFISILLEAFPFIMLGIIVSSIIQVLVSEELIRKLIPKNTFLGVIAGALMGFLFPVCDCAVIPVARRLIKKGVPLHVSITFMLAAPIINPVVITATAYAFSAKLPSLVFYRTYLGIGIAMLIGYILGSVTKIKDVMKSTAAIHSHHECGCTTCSHTHEHKGLWHNIEAIIKHSGEEFFDVGKFLIIGAFLAAIVQTFVPRDIIFSVGQNEVLSILLMMAFAFALSLCSTSDSFIAKTFVGQFTNGSILAFLIMGPMIDLKNTIMLLGNFKSKFVLKLISLVVFLCFATVILFNYIIGF